MKVSKSTWISFALLILIAALYRAIPGRPWGFAPQLAMAVFGGAVLSRKLSFTLPLLSMLVSDIFYEILYINGLTPISGFYDGMWLNYVLILSLTTVGFFTNSKSVLSIAKSALVAPTLYFFVSNSLTWLGNGGYQRSRDFSGYVQALIDGIPFYTNSLLATYVFSVFLFGTYHWVAKTQLKLS
jgi:membrane-associated HD superfamily phosphohydrolase